MSLTAVTPQAPTSIKLLTEHYPLARAIAKRTHARLPKGVDLDDLTSVAVMGLMEAADRFDPSRGVSFKSFAKHRIQGAIIDTLRANDWVPRSVRSQNRSSSNRSTPSLSGRTVRSRVPES